MDCQATREIKTVLCMQGALGTVAEQNQTTGQGTRLVDVLCGDERDTPQGSEPVAKQARTDDHSMNVGQVTPPVVPGRETKGLKGSDVEFLRQLVREQQAQLNEAVRAANAATQAAVAASQAINAQQSLLQYKNNIASLQDWYSTDHGSSTPLKDDDDPVTELVTELQHRNRQLSTLIANIDTDVQTE